MPRPSRKALPKYGFFNLPSDDALGYPRFNSFEQREVYIRNTVPKEILDRFNQMVVLDHENEATQSLEEMNKVEEYAEMEHSQRFLDDTKRFKILLEAATKRYQDEQDYSPATQTDKVLQNGSQEQVGETSMAPSPEILTMITNGDLGTLDTNAMSAGSQAFLTPKSTIDSPTHNPSVRSEGHEPKINQVDHQDKGCSSQPKSYSPQDKSTTSNSTHKRKNKYMEPETNDNTFQQLPLKSLTRPKKKLKISKSTVMELQDHLRLLQTVFVGETTAEFLPLRGDLIVVHPNKGKELASKGYLTCYEGPDTHKFEHGELVVRLGCYEQVEQRKYLYQPYKHLELYSYNREGDWRYLGSECEMANTEIPVDDSPGKQLQVGSTITQSCPINPIIPRRGDVIIRRAAWIENFSHRENFRRSVVKWHKDKPVQWEPEDMLLRLFVDKHLDRNTEPFVYSKPIPPPDPGDHSECTPHRPCEEVHPPLAPGFAELYRIEGLESKDMNWVFWGRTKHIYDTPYLKVDPLYLRLYVCDEGKESDLQLDFA